MKKTEKKPNYTPDEVAKMIEVYNGPGGSVDAVRNAVFKNEDGTFRKSVAQVRAKLVSEKVYRSEDSEKEKVAKADNSPSKKEMLISLDAKLAALGVDTKGLEGASKDGLRTVEAIADLAITKIAEAA